jgi:hypothetical protein
LFSVRTCNTKFSDATLDLFHRKLSGTRAIPYDFHVLYIVFRKCEPATWPNFFEIVKQSRDSGLTLESSSSGCSELHICCRYIRTPDSRSSASEDIIIIYDIFAVIWWLQTSICIFNWRELIKCAADHLFQSWKKTDNFKKIFLMSVKYLHSWCISLQQISEKINNIDTHAASQLSLLHSTYGCFNLFCKLIQNMRLSVPVNLESHTQRFNARKSHEMT